MTDATETAQKFLASKKAEWSALVTVAWVTQPSMVERAAKVLAESAGIGHKTLKRKFVAIHYARAQGVSHDDIVARGQEKILKQFVTEKVKARSAPLVNFPHRLTPEVRDAVQNLCFRVSKVLGLKTYDEAFEFITACFLDLSDEELLHLGGEAHAAPTDSVAKREAEPLNRS